MTSSYIAAPVASSASSEALGVDGVDGPRVVRRVGRRWMFFLIPLYLVSVLDRANLGFAAFSMNQDLRLGPVAFGVGVGMFYLGYSIFELPSNLLFARFGARVALSRIGMLFGLATMMMALVSGVGSFFLVRFLLGAAEAGLVPGVFLLLSLWIPSAYRARYNAVFSYAIPVAYVLVSLLSGAILHLDGALGIKGWKWLFLIEGFPAVVLGIIGVFYLNNHPQEVSWLTTSEKEWLLRQLEADSRQGNVSSSTRVLSVVTNPVVVLLSLAYIGIIAGNVEIFPWMPQIYHHYGVPVGHVGLVTPIAPLVGALCMAILARSSDRRGERLKHAFGVMLLSAVGFFVVGYSHDLLTAIIGFSLASAGLYSSIAIFWSIPQTFLAPEARPAAIAIISTIGTLVGGWIAPYATARVQSNLGSLSAGLYVVAGIYVFAALCLIAAGRVMRHQVSSSESGRDKRDRRAV